MPTKKRIPHIRARSRGTYHGQFAMVEEAVKKALPGKALRWVFAPEHDQRYSQVQRRRVQGYEIVDPEAVGLDDTGHGVSGNTIRMGDVVLMAIDQELRDEDNELAAKKAEKEARRSRDEYYRAVKGLDQQRDRVGPTGDIRDKVEHVTKTEED